MSRSEHWRGINSTEEGRRAAASGAERSPVAGVQGTGEVARDEMGSLR